MTILYRSVLIESAEQAEALPVGTPIWDERPERRRASVERGYISTVLGERMADTDSRRYFAHELIGWTALVPIDSEEEHAIWKSWDGSANGLGIPVPPDYPFDDLSPGEVVHRRLVTPWEEA